MFEFRLLLLDVGEGSYLGIVEGFPEVMVHAKSAREAVGDLTNALVEYLERLQDHEATRIDWDEFPTVREFRMCLSRDPC